MEATASMEGPSSLGFSDEFQRCWGRLPDKTAFGLLVAAWVLLFQFLGCSSSVAGQDSSLFWWMWLKWDNPTNDAGHAKLIPFVVLAILWYRRERLIQSTRGPW